MTEPERVAHVRFKAYWPIVGAALEWETTIPERLINPIVAHLAALPLESPVGRIAAEIVDRYGP